MGESDLAGRVAVVTGGARGIGAAYCRGFGARGATVVVVDILANRVQQLVEELTAQGFSADGMAVDVADEAAVAGLFQHIETAHGRLDYLVNNAAIMLDVDRPFKPFVETSYEEWRRVLDVNAGGTFLCCKYAWPLFERQREGRVVNVSSDGIFKGYDLQLAYFASKGAVAVMTRSLAREFGAINVNVNAVAPGFTLSEAVLGDDFMQNVARPSVGANLAIKREQQPEDLVGTVMFLCSPDSACITGQTLVVNLGAVMV